MYPGFLKIRNGKVTDMETAVFEGKVYYLQFPKEGGRPHHPGPHGEVPGPVRNRRSKGNRALGF